MRRRRDDASENAACYKESKRVFKRMFKPGDLVQLKPNALVGSDYNCRSMVVSHIESQSYVCKVPLPCRTGFKRFEDIVEEGTGNFIGRGELLLDCITNFHGDMLELIRDDQAIPKPVPPWRRSEYDASMEKVRYFLIFGVQRTRPKVEGKKEGAVRNVGKETLQEMEAWCEQQGEQTKHHYYMCGRQGFPKIKDFQIPLCTPHDQMKYVVGFVDVEVRDAFLISFRSKIIGYVKVEKVDPDGIFEGLRVMKGLTWGWGTKGHPCFESEDDRWKVGGAEKTRFEGTVVEKTCDDFGWMVKVQWDIDDAAFWYRAGYWTPDRKHFFSDLFVALGPEPKPEFFKPRLDAGQGVNTFSSGTEPRSVGQHAEETSFTTQ
jgi:hypothetical protein